MTASSHHSTAAGTTGGTLLTIFASIQSGDISKTIILATIGAVVSFLVSLALKWEDVTQAVVLEGFRKGAFLKHELQIAA